MRHWVCYQDLMYTTYCTLHFIYGKEPEKLWEEIKDIVKSQSKEKKSKYFKSGGCGNQGKMKDESPKQFL